MTDLLSGIRIIDFTHVHAGPLCTYQLGLMGADVVKIESPDGGDQIRNPGQYADGMSPGYLGQSANKRSLALDLKHEHAATIVRKLTESADVLIHNLRPGTPARLGISYEQVRAINESVVYCAISGYGQEGPMSQRPAFDHLIQGESGMFMSTGTTDQPVRVGFAVADAATALNASSAICAALLRRFRTGRGAFLDVSMLESSMTLMGLNYYGFLATGEERPRVGPNPLAPQGSAGTFETSDQRLLLVNANSQRLFTRLATAVNRQDLLSDPRFSTEREALSNRTALRAQLADVFRTGTAAHWDALLAEAGVPAGIAKQLPEVVNNPQLSYRGSITRLAPVQGVPSGELAVLNAGFTVDGDPTAAHSPPPPLGRDSRQVLQECGFTEEEIATFVTAGAVATQDSPI